MKRKRIEEQEEEEPKKKTLKRDLIHFIQKEEQVTTTVDILLEPKIKEILKDTPEEVTLNVTISEKIHKLSNYKTKKVENGLFLVNCSFPIYSLDWCTTDPKSNQYLCICPYSDKEFHISGKKYSGNGKILIFSFDEKEGPTLVQSIHHEHGYVFQCKWFSFFFSHKRFPKNLENDQRYGILFLAFSDGTLGVYSVPKDENNLNISMEGMEIINENHSVTSIEFTKNLKYLIAGYANGDIIIWKIQSENPFLKAYRTFNAHHSTIVSIVASPMNDEIFVTSAKENKTKFWCVHEYSGEISTISSKSHSWITSVVWPKCSNALMMSSHDGAINQIEIMETEVRNKTLILDQNPINDLSMCSSNAVIIYCSTDGSVRMRSFKNSNCHESKKAFIDDSVRLLNLKEMVQENSFKLVLKDGREKSKIFPRDVWMNKVQFHPSTDSKLRNWFVVAGNSGLVVFKKI
jgi:WD40 repeat protein